MTPPIERIVTDRLEIAYEVTGPAGGQAVVALHGWPDAAVCWHGVRRLLDDAGCRTYTPSLRGFGATRFRDARTVRSGQIGALGQDLADFLDGLGLDDVVLAGHDWGARAAYALCAVDRTRIRGLVAMSAPYGSTGPRAPISYPQMRAYWYQWFLATACGRRALERDRRGLCRHLWQTWSPPWGAVEAQFDEAALAWENPDWVDVTVHSYRHRWGEAAGDPAYAELEARLADTPPIRVPTIALHGEADGATLPGATERQDRLFEASYERLVVPGIGHFVPREAPETTAEAILRLAGVRRSDANRGGGVG